MLGGLNPRRVVNQLCARSFVVAPAWRAEEIRDRLQGVRIGEEELYWKIYKEYGSCLALLYSLGLDFQAILADPDGDARIFQNMLNLKPWFNVLGDVPLHFSMYPRSMLTDLGDVVLVNPRLRITEPTMENRVRYSPYGDGGMILLSRSARKIIIPSLTVDDGIVSPTVIPEEFAQRGFQVGLMPLCLYKQISLGGIILEEDCVSRYIDSDASLIEGADKRPYLIIDNCIETVCLKDGGLLQLNANESLRKIGEMCKEMNIIMVPVTVSVPSALSLLQLESGIVLMTGGDRKLQLDIERIVGAGKVFETEEPLEMLPLYEGGIRSFTNFFPDFLAKRVVLGGPSIGIRIKKFFMRK